MSWGFLADLLVDIGFSLFPNRSGRPDFEDPPDSETVELIELDEGDDGRIVNVHKLGLVAITLPAHHSTDVSARLVQPDPKKLLVFEDGTVGRWHRVGCRPLAKGEHRVELQYLRGDGSVDSTWSVCLVVKR